MRVQAKIAEKCSFVGLETLVRSSHLIFPRCASRETQRNVNLQGQASAQSVVTLYKECKDDSPRGSRYGTKFASCRQFVRGLNDI